MAKRLVAELTLLIDKSAEPITVYITSQGGDVKAFYELERKFNFKDAKQGWPVIITVASDAGSAAAYLLVLGRFAYAYEGTNLWFHGVGGIRPQKRQMFRREHAQAIALRLDRVNRKIAKRLAKKVVFRMAKRYFTPELFLKIRVKGLNAHQRQLWQFFKNLADNIRPELSTEVSVKLLYESLDRLKLMLSLTKYFPVEKPSKKRFHQTQIEAKILKAVIDSEVKSRQASQWSINPMAAAELVMDYLLARDFIRGRHHGFVERLSRQYGICFLDRKKTDFYNNLLTKDASEAEKYLLNSVRPCSMGLWCFALIFCHRLLSGENSLPATDAYWLGLLDEVLPKSEGDCPKTKPETKQT